MVSSVSSWRTEDEIDWSQKTEDRALGQPNSCQSIWSTHQHHFDSNNIDSHHPSLEQKRIEPGVEEGVGEDSIVCLLFDIHLVPEWRDLESEVLTMFETSESYKSPLLQRNQEKENN